MSLHVFYNYRIIRKNLETIFSDIKYRKIFEKKVYKNIYLYIKKKEYDNFIFILDFN